MNSGIGSSTYAPRLRLDLEWSLRSDSNDWVARDPVSSSFYLFSELERAATRLMDGRRVLDVIVLQLKQTYPSASVEPAWLVALLGRLQRHHLLLPASPAEARRWSASQKSVQQLGWLQFAISPLAIRVPLIDPSWLLARLHWPAAILFHPLVVWLWLLAAGGLLLLVVRELVSRGLPLAIDLDAIQGDRWLMLFGCYLGAKSLHELGHALACVRYSTKCHEVGIMFLCLAPCLYCDTTDSWKLPSKWQRAMIAAAGMYVELILASLAAAVWLATGEGTLHYLAASLMLVCSLGTLLVNSNPLLKYDGYYILSDLWGVPNLGEQSREALRGLIRYALSGVPIARGRLTANPWILASYAVASSIYRLFVLILILWLTWSVLVPRGLGLIAVLVSGSVLLGLTVGQLRSWRALGRELWAGPVRPRGLRLTLAASLFIAAGAMVLLVPWPSYVRARGVTDFADKRPLFASQDAELTFAAATDVWLPAGSRLLEFRAPLQELEWLRLQGDIQAGRAELEQLKTRMALDPVAAYQLPAKQELLSERLARAQLLEKEQASLRHVAAQAGYLLNADPPFAAALTAPRDDRRPRRGIEAASIGASLRRSQLVAWFSAKQQLVVTALVSEQAVRQLALDMPVAIQWDSDVTGIAHGRVTRIAPDPARATPETLIGDARLRSIRDAAGVLRPERPHYEVSVMVEGKPPHKLRGAPATVQIETTAQTLAERLRAYLQRNLQPIY